MIRTFGFSSHFRVEDHPALWINKILQANPTAKLRSSQMHNYEAHCGKAVYVLLTFDVPEGFEFSLPKREEAPADTDDGKGTEI